MDAGLTVISSSERGADSLALYSSGSLPVRWVLLTLVPDLLGGSGSLSQPSFFAFYNLTEVTSYAGILPLVAAFALLGRLRRRSRPPEWVLWHVMALAGVALALGGNTPLGDLLYHLPLFGDQRLQSRNILVLDLALAVLLAYWADRPSGDQHVRPTVLETVLGLAPALAAAVVVALGYPMPSVQGYSSTVDGHYASVTGSHQATGDGQNTLSPRAVADGTLDQLDTSVLLTLPSYLTTAGGNGQAGGPAGGPPGTGRRDVAAYQRATWYLGATREVSEVVVPDPDARRDAAAGTQLGLVAPGGSTQWFRARATTASALAISVTRPVAAEVFSPHGARVVRSVTAIAGWSARWQPQHGPAARVAVQRDGLVQAVDVPAGLGVLTWSYTPPGFRTGMVLSACGAVALAGLFFLAAYFARRPASHRDSRIIPAKARRELSYPPLQRR